MKLTWQELERLVAERLEPKPDLKAAWSLGGLSALGFWQLHSKAGILPVQFRTDEAAAFRLLKALKKPLLYSEWPGCEGWRLEIGVKYFQGPPLGPTCATPEDAILLGAKELLKIEGEVE